MASGQSNRNSLANNVIRDNNCRNFNAIFGNVCAVKIFIGAFRQVIYFLLT